MEKSDQLNFKLNVLTIITFEWRVIDFIQIKFSNLRSPGLDPALDNCWNIMCLLIWRITCQKGSPVLVTIILYWQFSILAGLDIAALMVIRFLFCAIIITHFVIWISHYFSVQGGMVYSNIPLCGTFLFINTRSNVTRSRSWHQILHNTRIRKTTQSWGRYKHEAFRRNKTIPYASCEAWK